ncbi:aminopeptidase N [Rheinheimera maricola]|uniref:Aminopeptidase N n=1 Tax=Rheinheimera maricola TaxID=2793282 RepID=A0ABS7X802_9GAMM|nr:aminopeptidase N [Rheinheimera maricola]MBZ9610742.1 aminopeptidase N [Rheinheimera maricola]
MTEQHNNRLVKFRQDYQPPAFSISCVKLCFELEPNTTTVTSVMQMTRQHADVPLILDGQHLTLLSIALNGDPLLADAYQVDAHCLTVFSLPDQFELTIVTQLSPQSNTALEGLYLAGDTYCTQCEAEGFRRISYFLDRPDVLAEYYVTIIAPAQRYPFLLSNGNKLSEHVDSAGNRVVQWHDPFPKPSYLFALVAGDFAKLSDQYITQSGREVSLELFVEKGAANKGDFALQALKRAMNWDEQRFNLEYDLDVYMVVAVDFFNMGAMENKGLNVFNSKYVLADPSSATDRDYFNIESIIGHEYFHNWTGNRVTCRDWFQLSLKEGLTVFRDQEFSADMASATLCRIDAVKLIRTAQFAEDASPMSHPIRPEQVIEMNNFYTVTVYDKGAEVIRMLQTCLGKTDFARGLALYLQRHDGQAATCDDFLQAMQDVTGQNLTQFGLWYSQSGTPELTVSQHYDASSATLRLNLVQITPATADQSEKQPLLIPVKIELLFPNATVQQHLLLLTDAEQQFVFDNVTQQPVVVWLEHFSAPVKLINNVDDDSLLFIARHATDGVARWDAMQQFWSRKVAHCLSASQSDAVLPDAVLQLMRHWLTQPGDDLALTAELLTLPDFDTLAEQYQQIPVNQLIDILRQFKQQISVKLAQPLRQCYDVLPFQPYSYNQQASAVRRLRAVCLSYLVFSSVDATNVLTSQYQHADNMTDVIAVLTASQQLDSDIFQNLVNDFADRWQHDALVMDKCFALVASNPHPQVFAAIETMQQHPLFSWNNPNRVRALLSAFSQRNPAQFHRADGKGYQLLANSIIKLDAINAQVAARLVTPLLSWRRFEPKRQQLMRSALQQIAKIKGISNDVYEKVSRSLN